MRVRPARHGEVQCQAPGEAPFQGRFEPHGLGADAARELRGVAQGERRLLFAGHGAQRQVFHPHAHARKGRFAEVGLEVDLPLPVVVKGPAARERHGALGGFKLEASDRDFRIGRDAEVFDRGGLEVHQGRGFGFSRITRCTFHPLADDDLGDVDALRLHAERNRHLRETRQKGLLEDRAERGHVDQGRERRGVHPRARLVFAGTAPLEGLGGLRNRGRLDRGSGRQQQGELGQGGRQHREVVPAEVRTRRETPQPHVGPVDRRADVGERERVQGRRPAFGHRDGGGGGIVRRGFRGGELGGVHRDVRVGNLHGLDDESVVPEGPEVDGEPRAAHLHRDALHLVGGVDEGEVPEVPFDALQRRARDVAHAEARERREAGARAQAPGDEGDQEDRQKKERQDDPADDTQHGSSLLDQNSGPRPM